MFDNYCFSQEATQTEEGLAEEEEEVGVVVVMEGAEEGVPLDAPVTGSAPIRK